MKHLQVPASGAWDTKVYCACGDEFTSRAMFWKHQADAYVAMTADECCDHLHQCGADPRHFHQCCQHWHGTCPACNGTGAQP